MPLWFHFGSLLEAQMEAKWGPRGSQIHLKRIHFFIRFFYIFLNVLEDHETKLDAESYQTNLKRNNENLDAVFI